MLLECAPTSIITCSSMHAFARESVFGQKYSPDKNIIPRPTLITTSAANYDLLHALRASINRLYLTRIGANGFRCGVLASTELMNDLSKPDLVGKIMASPLATRYRGVARHPTPMLKRLVTHRVWSTLWS